MEISKINSGLLCALEMAGRAIASLEKGADPAGPLQPFCDKVVAETAMLLLCANSAAATDPDVRRRVRDLSVRMVPLARSESTLAAISLDPGQAHDRGVAHVILSHLGFPDHRVDYLLGQSLALGFDFGPERLPHLRLEQEWLDRVWSRGGAHPPAGPSVLAHSMLGRPLDALAASRFDIYAFTHALMYATDLGYRAAELPRTGDEIAADAEAALACSLDTGDWDLTAELTMSWPLLRRPWSPAATFAFGILAAVEEESGFLPGAAFDTARFHSLAGREQCDYVLATSYHATYVMGFLCAAALRNDVTPPVAVPPPIGTRRGRGAAFELLTEPGQPRWKTDFAALDPAGQDALAPLVLAIALRQARDAGDLARIAEAVETALAHHLVDAPAPRQAVALLRRATALQVSA
jgi:hypothetical protein